MMRLLLLAAILLTGCTLHYASQIQRPDYSESTVLIYSAEDPPK